MSYPRRAPIGTMGVDGEASDSGRRPYGVGGVTNLVEATP